MPLWQPPHPPPRTCPSADGIRAVTNPLSRQLTGKALVFLSKLTWGRLVVDWRVLLECCVGLRLSYPTTVHTKKRLRPSFLTRRSWCCRQDHSNNQMCFVTCEALLPVFLAWQVPEKFASHLRALNGISERDIRGPLDELGPLVHLCLRLIVVSHSL